MVDLGDLVDRRGGKTAPKALERVEEAWKRSFPGKPRYHLVGNHDQTAISRKILSTFVRRSRGEKTAVSAEELHFKVRLCSNWWLVGLDTYDLALAHNAWGSSNTHPKRVAAYAMLRKGRESKRVEPHYAQHEELNGGISREQLRWLRDHLEACRKAGDRVIIASHAPFLPSITAYRDAVCWNYRDVLGVLHDYLDVVVLCVAGHDHFGKKGKDRKGLQHVVLPAALESDPKEGGHAILEIKKSQVTLVGVGLCASVSVTVDIAAGAGGSACMGNLHAKKTSSGVNEVLCLSSDETYDAVRDVFEKDLKIANVRHEKTVRAARAALGRRDASWIAMICALGTTPDVDMIFSKDAGDRCPIIDAAKSLARPLPVFIFSHTACREENAFMRDALSDAGASDVVCTRASLKEAVLNSLAVHSMSAENTVSKHDAKKILHVVAKDALNTADEASTKTSSDTDDAKWEDHWLSEYEPMKLREARDQFLQRTLGPSHRFADRSARRTIRIRKNLRQLSQPLIVPPHKRSEVVRIVHVSDTHNMHEHLKLPADADVLIHTGDTVGNYHRQDVNEHFAEFCEWLTRMSRRFKNVVFIAGNHDTQLDEKCYDTRRARALIKGLPGNVHYLCNSSVVVEGNLKIWGSPLCVSRLEVLGKRYLSNAFERTIATREKVYGDLLKEGVDILLTHSPPAGILCANNRKARRGPGCHVLRSRLDKLQTARPKICLFGHDHDYLGAQRRQGTLYINAAQQHILHEQHRVQDAKYRAGGFPIVFDIARRAASPPDLMSMRSFE
eukprot:g3446.t1